ncbi:MAG TPA: peptidase E [Gaiellales bacterium]|nr:peptidase E [Gaiellales bacterium]
MSTRQIVAMGGGGFSMEGRALDDHILGLTGKARPRVCYVPTAAGDSQEKITRFHEALGDRAETAVLGLFWREVSDIDAFLRDQDVIYVGGGNTANMLAVWRLHGVDTALRRAWEAGVILCGLSAGANCWFEGCSTDSFGAGLGPMNDGLGLLPGSFCPHYDGEPLRQPTYTRWVAEGALPPGWAADDGVGLHFVGTELHEAISERDGGRAFRVEAMGETALDVRRI